MKRNGLFLLAAALLTYLLFFPQDALKSSCAGLELWFHTVLPSLLPFIILSNLLAGTGMLRTLLAPFEPFFLAAMGLSCEGAYAWMMGMFCGYPMGARLTAELYRDGHIDRSEAEYLLTFANHASPMFLSSYVVLQGFQDPSMTVPVFVILYLSSFLTSLLFRFRFHRFGLTASQAALPRPRQKHAAQKEVPKQPSFGNLLDTSIMNGFEIITRLGGYIILFSILSGMILSLPESLRPIAPYLAGMMEITTGISCLAGTAAPLFAKTIAILTCTAFGGLSTAAQTNCMIRESGLPIAVYLKGKLSCAIAAGILSLLFVLIQ